MSKAYGISNYIKEAYQDSIKVSYSTLSSIVNSDIQSNLDYSKCQGPPDFLRIIDSSNFRNRYFSEMFGSFRSVLIIDGISIKNGEQGIISYL